MAIYNVNKDTGDITETAGRYGSSEEYTEISYEDWLALTPAQQENGKWDVKGVPGADGTIQIDLMTKLWENSSPSVAFAPQDITLSSDDYDLLLIIYIWTISSAQELSVIVEKNNGFVLSAGLPSAYGSRNIARYCSFTSDTVINFGEGRDCVGASSSTLNNDRCVPVIIYGIKLHHTVEIKAIAPTVSTLASKCMMSDGVTSVEEELDRKNKSAVSDLIDIKAYDSNNPYTCPCDGYLRVCSSSASVVAQGYIISGSSSTTNYLLVQSQGLYVSVFVRKGAKVFANGTVYTAHFLKLE